MTRQIPPLPASIVPEFLDNNTMNPIWRAFWLPFLAAVNDLNFTRLDLQDFADDVGAAAGGIEIKQLYRTGSIVKIRVT